MSICISREDAQLRDSRSQPPERRQLQSCSRRQHPGASRVLVCITLWLASVDVAIADGDRLRRIICEPCPNGCHCVYSKARWTCDVLCQGKGLDAFPRISTGGLIGVGKIDVSNNNLESVREDDFQDLKQLKSLSLGGNPWQCNCSLLWLQEWLSTRLADGLLVDTDDILCAGPTLLVAQPVLTVQLAHCGPQDVVSCQWRALDRPARPVLFSDSYNITTQDEAHCNQLCFLDGVSSAYAVSLVGVDHTCYCGQLAAALHAGFRCTCPDVSRAAPASGALHCGKQYLPSTAVTAGVKVADLRPLAAAESVTIGLETQVAVVSYMWDFGDTSSPVITSSSSVDHCYPLAGTYPLHITVAADGGANATTTVPITVLDPVRLDNAREWLVTATSQNVDIGVVLQHGSQLTVRWERVDQLGQVVKGASCRPGWHSLGAKCVFFSTANVASFQDALSVCHAQDATLLTLADPAELEALAALHDSHGDFYTDALRSDASYIWQSSQERAYFQPADVAIGDTSGNCVLVGDLGLRTSDCHRSHGAICQKAITECPLGGRWDRLSNMCYLVSESSATWQSAQEHCVDLGGQLATPLDSDSVNAVARAMNASGHDSAWLGLHSVGSHPERQFLWATGHSLSSYQPWAPDYPSAHSSLAGAGCVAMVTDTGSPTWQDKMCDTPLRSVCQYPAAGTAMDIQRHIAGVASFPPASGPAIHLTDIGDSGYSKTSDKTHYIMPGVWFSKEGAIHSWEFQAGAVMTQTELRLQVYRPECPPGRNLVQPGCSKFPSPFATCAEQQASCEWVQGDCQPGQQYCPLQGVCIDAWQPCTCHSGTGPYTATAGDSGDGDDHSSDRDDDDDDDDDGDDDIDNDSDDTDDESKSSDGDDDCDIASQAADAENVKCPAHPSCATHSCPVGISCFSYNPPDYRLVAQATVLLSPSSSHHTHSVAIPGLTAVEGGDIIGFQYDGDSNPLQCRTLGDSVWRQTVLTGTDSQWFQTNSAVAAGMPVHNTVCYVRATYATPVTLSPPPLLTDPLTTPPGHYTYRIEVSNAVSRAEAETHLEVVQPIQGLRLLSPQLDEAGQSLTSQGAFYVKAGADVSLLLMIEKGSGAALTTSLTDATIAFNAQCPAQYLTTVPECASAQRSQRSHRFACVESKAFRLSSTGATVNITASNKLSSERLSVDALVREPIVGLAILVSVPTSSAPVGERVEFRAVVEHGNHVTFTWQLFENTTVSNTAPTFSHAFAEPGVYNISVFASNGVSQQVASVQMSISEKSNDKKIQIVAPSTALRHEPVNIDLTATLSGASMVTVFFDFGDPSDFHIQRFEDTAEIAISLIHLYDTGSYTMSLTVWNNTTKRTLAGLSHNITVYPQLYEVRVRSSHSHKGTNSSVTFTAHARTSAQSVWGLLYEWNFGDGRQNVTTSASTAVHRFTASGRYSVGVTVSNQVQVMGASVQVVIEEPLVNLTLTYDGPTVYGSATTLTAKVSSGSDELYQFMDADSDRELSAQQEQNWIQHTYGEMGPHRVSAHAYNNISSQTAELVVYVLNETTLLVLDILAPSVAAAATAVDFTAQIIHLDASSLSYQWDFGDGTTVSGTGLMTEKHLYQNTGRWTVSIVVEDSARRVSQHFTKDIATQQKIVGVIATGNLTLALQQGQGTQGVYEMHLERGSDVLFTWRHYGRVVSTPSSTHILEFTTVGLHTVHVTASNDISSDETTFQVVVQEMIGGLALKLNGDRGPHLSSQKVYAFVASLETGSDVVYDWTVNGIPVGNGKILQHQFTTLGSSSLLCTASNAVSRQNAELIVIVQEPVINLEVQTNVSTSGRSLAVHFHSTLGYGTQVTYTWHVCTPNCSTFLTSQQDHVVVFPKPGTYRVTVTAQNQISTVSKQLDVVLLEEISGLAIVPDDTTGAYVTPHLPVTFKAHVETGNGITYQWTLVSDSENTSLGSQDTVTYTFTGAGRYLVVLNASNSLGEQRAVQHLQAIELIEDLQIFTNGSDDLPPGVLLSFEARVAAGSDVVYDWFGKTVWPTGSWSQKLAGPGISLSFSIDGVYEMAVTAHNALSSLNSSTILLAASSRGDIEIDVDCETAPYIPLNKPIKFSVTPKSQQNSDYLWVFSDEMCSYTTPVVHHTFERVGDYKVIVVLNSNNNTQQAFTELVVLEEILDLELKCKTPDSCTAGTIALGEEITVEASTTAGTELVYQWKVNGEVLKESNYSTVHYTFERTGKHIVEVIASNALGEASSKELVTVVARIQGLSFTTCCSDILMKREPIVFEALVTAGSHLSYEWTLHTPLPQFFQGKSFTHSFMVAGIYKLELVGSNSLGNETVVEDIKIQDNITSVEIESDPSLRNIYSGYWATFTAQVKGGGQSLQHHWTLIAFNGGNHTSNDEVFTYLFDNSDSTQYLLWVNVSNEVSWESDSVPIIVRTLKCDPPVLTPLGGTTRIELKSRRVHLEVSVEACNWYQVLHQWRLYQWNCSGEIWPLPPTLITDKPQLVLTPRQLDYGLYCLSFSSEYDGTGLVETVEISLEIVASDIKPLIDGGSSRKLTSSEEIVLDGTPSYDPDEEADVLSFMWTCKVKEESTELADSTSQESECFPAQTDDIIVLPAHSLEPGKTYEVTLTVSANSRQSQTTTQEIIVSEAEMPVVSIDCVSCRERNVFHVSAGQHLRLLGSCLNCQGEVLYNWVVTRADGVNLTLNDVTTATGSNRSNLVVHKGVLRDHYDYYFTLNITANFSREGLATLLLKTSPPPSGGYCGLTVIPNDDYLVTDRLEILCQDWSDNTNSKAPLTFHVYIQHPADPEVWYSVHRSPTNYTQFFVAPFEEDIGGGEVVVKVDVIDQQGNEAVALNSSVFVDVVDPGNMSMTDYLHENTASMLSLLKNQNDPKALLQYVLAIAQLLNTETFQYRDVTPGQDPELDRQREVRTETRRGLLSTVHSQTSITTLDDLVQVSYLLKLLTKYSDEFPLGDFSYVMVISLLKQMIIFLEPEVSPGWMSDEFVPIYSMTTVSHLLEIIYLEIPKEDETVQQRTTDSVFYSKPGVSTKSPSFTFQPVSPDGPRISTPTPPSTDSPKSWMWIKLVENAFQIADEYLYLSLMTHVAEENPADFDVDVFHVEGMRVKAANIRQTFTSSDCEVHLPPTLLDNLPAELEVLQVMSTMESNPYQWGYQDNNTISSKTVVVYFSHINQSEIKLSNLSPDEHVSIEMPTQADLQPQLGFDRTGRDREREADPLMVYLDQEPAAEDQLEFDSVVLKAGRKTSTQLNMTVVTSGGAIHVPVLAEVIDDDQTRRWKEKNWKNGQPRGTDDTLSVDAYIGVDYEPTSDVHNYSLHISSEVMDNLDNFTQYTFFILDQTLVGDPGHSYHLTLVNSASSGSVNISVGVYVTQCKYYNTSLNVWDTAGCVPSEYSTTSKSICHCNHLTLYGTSVLISPAELDFAASGVSTNLLVLLTVGMLLAVYVCALVLGRRWDMLILRRISVVPLCGKDGPYKYEVMVITGRRKAAGTSANVGIRLYGEYSHTPSIHLHRLGAFGRGTQEQLLVAANTDLGELRKIQIWHDNTGLSPDWYLARVVVRELQKPNRRYYFLVDDWLSVANSPDGAKMDVVTAGPQDLSRFKTVLGVETSRGMAERHLWLSIFECPAVSSFTRVQRITVCITTLYAYLMFVAIWYGKVRTASEMEVIAGSLMFTWRDALVGMLTAVLVFPIMLGLMVLFKKVKTKSNPVNYSRRPEMEQTVEMDAWIDMPLPGSRPDNVATIVPDREPYELGDVEESDGENTLEFIPTRRGRGLRRTQTLARIPRTDSVISDNTSMESSLQLGCETSGQAADLPPDDHLWSYDTILGWPERTPAWESKLQSSNSGSRADAEQTRKPEADSGVGLLQMQSDSRSTQNTCGSPPHYLDEVTGENQRETVAVPGPGHSVKVIQVASTDDAAKVTLASGSADDASKIAEVSASTKDPVKVVEVSGACSHHVQVGAFSHDAQRAEHFNPRDEAVLEDLDQSGVYRESLPELKSGIKPQPRVQSWSTGTAETSLNQPHPEVVTSAVAPGYPTARQSAWSYTTDNVMMMSGTVPPAPDQAEKPGLPYWFLYVTYGVCFLICVACVTVTFFYGFDFSKTMSLHWLLASTLSFCLSVVVLEPSKVLIVALLIAAKGRVLTDDALTSPMIESNEKIKDVKLKPVSGYALLQAKQESLKLSRMRLLFRQLIAYLLFLGVVLTINYVAYDRWAYYLNCHQRNLFTTQMYEDHNLFHDMATYDDYWDWMEEIAAPALHLDQGTQSTAQHGYLVGRPRLRQIRSTEVSCSAEDRLLGMSADSLMTIGCYGDSGWHEDTATYKKGWIEAPYNGSWVHSKDTGSRTVVGSVSRYSEGGYVQELGLTYNETINTIRDLRDDIWVERGTRAVFLEFTVYNANLRLYGVASLLVEFALSGGTWPSEKMEAIQLLQFEGGLAVTLTVFMCLLAALLLYFLIHIAFCIKWQGTRYLCKFWNWVEMSLACLTLCSLAMYVHLIRIHTETSSDLRENKDSYVALTNSAHWSCIWRYVNAILLFVLTLMVVKQLRFIRWLSKYGRTLRAASGKIMGCFLFFMMITVIYASLGYLWYGTAIHEYRAVPHALFTMVGTLKGHTPYFEDMMIFNRSLFFVIFFTTTFVSLMYLVVFGLILAALTDSYRTVKQQMLYHNTVEMQDYEMVTFTMKRFKRWAGITKPKPAMRRVKFQGMPSLSSHSTCSRSGRSWVPSSSDSSTLDEEHAAAYLDSLLERAVPTWEGMLQKLDQVADVEEEECSVQQLEEKVQQILKQSEQQQQQQQQQQTQTQTQQTSSSPPPSPPARARSVSEREDTELTGACPGGCDRRQSVSEDTEAAPRPPPRRKRDKRRKDRTRSADKPKEAWN